MSKLCECGCGRPAPIAPGNVVSKGWIKDEPLRFVKGHNRRGAHGGRTRSPATRWVESARGCWIWQGKARSGKQRSYGLATANGKRTRAHRAVYEELVGPIPGGHDLHHTCGEPLCVNPAHLEPIAVSEHRKLHR